MLRQSQLDALVASFELRSAVACRAMIQTLHIENYRCLRDVTLELGPLTVLVGANASGKSSVFRALAFPSVHADPWQRRRELTVRITLVDSRLGNVQRSIGPAGFQGQPDNWPSSQILQLDLRQLRALNQLQELRSIGADGFGLTNVFATLTRREQEEVVKRFCALVPMFQDVATRPQSNGNHRVVF